MKLTSNVLAYVLAFFVLGCSDNEATKKATPNKQQQAAKGSTEEGAREALTTNMKKWQAGENVNMIPVKMLLTKPPLSFEIRSMFIDKKRSKPSSPWFKAVVYADFESKGGAPIQKVLRYHVSWKEKRNSWFVQENHED